MKARSRARRLGWLMAGLAWATTTIIASAEVSGAASATDRDTRRSGFLDMSPQTQAMQRDPSLNPGQLFLLEADALWRQSAGPQAPSCAACHREPEAMRGVANRYPAWDERTSRPITLEGRINACRVHHQQRPPLPWESRELLALGALVAHPSRELPILAPTDPRLREALAAGERRYHERIGQLNFACADCHDTLAGRRLGGTLIPQGHPTGYPLYRLEWQTMGSLQRRLRNCLTGIRAQVFPWGASEWVELELHLMRRAAGMPRESPAVRP